MNTLIGIALTFLALLVAWIAFFIGREIGRAQMFAKLSPYLPREPGAGIDFFKGL